MHVDTCLHVRVLCISGGKRQEVLAMSLIQLQEPAEKHRKVGRSPQWEKIPEWLYWWSWRAGLIYLSEPLKVKGERKTVMHLYASESQMYSSQKNLLFFLKLQSYMYFKLKLCELRECLMTPKIPNWSWSKYLCPPKQIVKYKTQSIVFRLFHHPRRAAQWHLRKCSEGPCCSLAQICCPQPQTVSLENWKHCWTLLHKA